jgi:hypothetical protein
MNNEVKYLVRRLVLSYYNFRYSSYYPIVMPIVIISSGILIFFLLILPQLQNWFSINSEVAATQARINTMRQNSRIIQAMNKVYVERDFTTVTRALPNDKDFIGILHTIGQAATVSNVSLQDYEFSLGTVSIYKNGKEIAPASSPVQIGLTLEGGMDNMSDFIHEIEQRLPIAQIQSVNLSDNKGEIALIFVMKPFPKLNVNYSDPIATIKDEDRNILKSLYSWSDQ